MKTFIRVGVVGTLLLAATIAAPSSAIAAPKAGAGKSSQATTAQLTAPYDGAMTTLPAEYGLSADRMTGTIAAVSYPTAALSAANGTRESVAFVGSNSPLAWRTVTVTFHVSHAHVLTTAYPFFGASLLVGTQSTNASWLGSSPGYYCAGTPLFMAADSVDGAGLEYDVVDRTVTLTCSTAGSNYPIWGGVYLRTSAANAIDLDMHVVSIQVSS
jgi:hypothetical protein